LRYGKLFSCNLNRKDADDENNFHNAAAPDIRRENRDD